jgi:hypothetical protein
MTEPKLNLSEGLRRSGLSLSELEFRYLLIGGTASPQELRRHIAGECPDEHEHNLIAQALNEASLEHGEDYPVAYRNLFHV